MPFPTLRVQQMDASAADPTIQGALSGALPLDMGTLDGEAGATGAPFCIRLCVPAGSWNGAARLSDLALWFENAEIPGHRLQYAFLDAWAQNGAGAALLDVPIGPSAAVATPASWALTPESAVSGFLWLRWARGSAVYPDDTYGGARGRLRLHIEGECS